MTDHPYNRRSETKRVMTTNTDNGLVDRDLRLAEEVRVLKQHMKNMYYAWMTGQMLPPPPPGFSDVLPTVAVSSQATLTKSEDSSNSEPMFELSDSQYNDLTAKASGSYRHTSHLESSTEIAETKNAENEEESLLHMKKQCDESYRKFASRWRERATKVRPQIKECEMVETFLQAQEGDYYQYLLSAVGKSFDEVIKMGEMIEDGLKTGRIMSFADMKVTVEVTQGNDVAMLAPVSRRSMRGPPRPYTQPQPKTHFQAPSNHPQHSFSPQHPQYSILHPQYPTHKSQSYANPSSYLQWCPTARQNHPLPRQVYQRPPESNVHYRPKHEKRQRSKESFTSIGKSYTSLFRN